MYLAKIIVTLRKTILDPQGKAIHHALQNLGMAGVEDVRMGKFIEMKINSTEQKEAERVTEESCKKLLANPVMEDYSFTLEKV
jgi:phosphoribosylformylglycinamidine synthase PurS subunit